MGDSTGEIREELADQRDNAERKIRSLRIRAARTAKGWAPLVAAGMAGALLLGAGVGAGAVLFGRGRRRTLPDRALERLREAGDALKASVPGVHIDIGNPQPRGEQPQWLGVLVKVTEVGAGAGATALASGLLGRGHRT